LRPPKILKSCSTDASTLLPRVSWPVRNPIFWPPKWRTEAYKKPITLECRFSRTCRNLNFRTPKRWRDDQRYPETLEP
jgi:hypothetical protein